MCLWQGAPWERAPAAPEQIGLVGRVQQDLYISEWEHVREL